MDTPDDSLQNGRDSKVRVPNTLPVREPGEREILTVKRHPIGIIGVYAMCGTVLLVTAVLAFVMAPGVFGNDSTQQAVLAGTLIFTIIALGCAVFAFIMTKVYWANSWTLTTDSLTQVNQPSLFRRQSSQLSLENLEDVTAEQNGVLPRILNYGVLKVETAATTGKFTFPFCPNPNYYAEQILKAREEFERHSHKESAIYEAPAPAQAAVPPISAAPEEPQIDSYEVPGGPDGSV